MLYRQYSRATSSRNKAQSALSITSSASASTLAGATIMHGNGDS
jgi:hypothetical protein